MQNQTLSSSRLRTISTAAQAQHKVRIRVQDLHYDRTMAEYEKQLLSRNLELSDPEMYQIMQQVQNHFTASRSYVCD